MMEKLEKTDYVFPEVEWDIRNFDSNGYILDLGAGGMGPGLLPVIIPPWYLPGPKPWEGSGMDSPMGWYGNMIVLNKSHPPVLIRRSGSTMTEVSGRRIIKRS